MATWKTARLDDIEAIEDGRSPFRPVRHHFGISSFGVNAFTAPRDGRPDHQRARRGRRRQEELYLVLHRRARFELDGESFDAATGTFVYVEPGVKRTAFAEEAGTTMIALGGVPGKTYEVHGFELWAPIQPLYQAGEYERGGRARPGADRGDPPYGGCTTTSPAARASPGRGTTRSSTCGARSSCRSSSAPSPRGTATWMRSARSPPSKSSSGQGQPERCSIPSLISPRHAPVAAVRPSIRSRNRARSPLIRRRSSPIAEPTCSAVPSGL